MSPGDDTRSVPPAFGWTAWGVAAGTAEADVVTVLVTAFGVGVPVQATKIVTPVALATSRNADRRLISVP
jgi:hypothetical protein